MTYETVLIDRPADGVAVVTLNRPEALNALNSVLRRELDEAIMALDGDDSVRAIIVTGAGEKAFSAGGDIHERVKSEAPAREGVSPLADATWRLANTATPTIGAINGLAFGGAALLASALDIRVGCERSSFRFLAVGYGLMNATWSLPLVVGWARAKELFYTGRPVTADDAAQMGLLNKVVPCEQLLSAAIDMGCQIAANSPHAVQAIKRVLHQDIGLSWQAMLEAERRLSAELPKQRETDRFKTFLDRDASRT